jgi:hypothetical protein
MTGTLAAKLHVIDVVTPETLDRGRNHLSANLGSG